MLGRAPQSNQPPTQEQAQAYHLAGLPVLVQIPTASERGGMGCLPGTKAGRPAFQAVPKPASSPLIPQRSSAGPQKGCVHHDYPRIALRAGCKNHTYQALLSVSLQHAGRRGPGRGPGSCCPAGLHAVLQLHLGHRRPVHLVRAISKAQRSGPGKQLSQWVVAAEPCSSEGLVGRAGGEASG